MKTLIVYASKYGALEECVGILRKFLDKDADVIRLKNKQPELDLAVYETVLIGGSVHAGRIQNAVKKFCERNLPALASKRIGLFLSALTPPDQALHYFESNFPAPLVQNARAKSSFGGKVTYELMNPIESFILKRISKKDKSFSEISVKHIEDFAKAFSG